MFWLSGRLHGVVRHFSPSSPPLLSFPEFIIPTQSQNNSRASVAQHREDVLAVE
jgi:hypothetical protein